MNITAKKKIILTRIEAGRYKLSKQLESGFITESDILSLLTVKSDFGLKQNTKGESYKLRVLRDIFNSPFLLCDQDYLSINIKQLLPVMLKCRYDMEIEQLRYMLDDGLINGEEYIEQEKLLKYSYYGSSTDGRSILRNGHVSILKDNKIKERKVIKV